MRNRLPYLLNGTDASIVAVADPVEEQRRGIGVDATPFVNHRAMLEAVELDGVVVSSPHGLHFGQASDALVRA